MAGYKNFRLIIGIVTALVLTFNAVILPAAALEAGSVNETGSVEYIVDDRSALEPAESEYAEREEDTQGDKKENIPQEGESGQEAGAPSENAEDAVGTNQEEAQEDIRSAGAEEDTQDDKKENIPQEGESGQEADAPSENAGDAVGTNQEEVREDIRPDPDPRVKLWGDWREAAKLPAPTGNRAEDMASAARALLGNSLRGEDSGAFCWNRLLAEFCLDYAEVSKEALPRPEEGQDWAELLKSADLFRRDEEAIAAGTLVFLALDGQDGEGRLSVGIVTEIEEGVLTVVMADENGMVVSQSVARNDASFVGYCLVEENSGEAAMLALEMVDGWALVSSEDELSRALSSSEKIQLSKSISVVQTPLEIPAGKNVTIDLNGKTLINNSNSSGNSGESLFKILTGATLTIEDGTQGTETNSVAPVRTTSTGNKYGNTASYENGTLTYYVTDSKVTDSNTGETTETVYQYKVSVPSVPQELSVGTLNGNGIEKSIFWMPPDASEAHLIIKGGKICNSGKSAIYCNSPNSTVQIDGGYICNNSVPFDNSVPVNEIWGGAAIIARQPTTINITGGYIYNNTSHRNGGAIAAGTGSTINITGGCIFGNTASFDLTASDVETAYGLGGAIDSEGANVTVSGGYIFSNSASTNSQGGGGAIYAQGGSVALNGGYLFGNSAKGGYGGAVYMKDGTLAVSGSAVLAGNRSVKAGGIEGTGKLDAGGGAVALFGSTGATISGGYITGNESEKTGGGLYCRDSSEVTMDSGYVTNNKAQNIVCEGAHNNEDGGGGIRLENQSTLTLKDGYITGNMAGSGAGICVYGESSNATLTMNGGYICANRNEVSCCDIARHQQEGAGISIREVGAIVKITKGYINNNSIAQSEDWGGGGIFCTEGAYLYIDMILATNNHARGFGGGLAGCPTGHVYVLGGAAAVFDNRADGTQLAGAGSTKHADKDALADPIFMASGYSDFFSALGAQVQRSMLGGGMENWKGSCDGQYVKAADSSGDWLTAYFRMGLTANPSDTDKSAAYNAATGKALYINGNESYTHGGAIMCDGYMFVGDWSVQETITVGSTMDVTAKKAFGKPRSIDVTYVSGPIGFNAQENSSCLFDRDPKTKWCNTNADEARGEILFHTNGPVKAIQYSLTMANDHQSNPKRVPDAWTLYGSNDNTSWTAIDKGDAVDKETLLSAQNGEKVTFSIMHRGEYQYYKLVFDAPGVEGVQFADFELYDLTTSSMGDKQFAFEVYQFPATAVRETAISGPAEVNNNSEGYGNLFDGNTDTKWYYQGAASPKDIIFRTDGAVKALCYSLTTANDHTKYPGRIPKAWTLYGGDSESEDGTWTVIAQHTEADNCFKYAGDYQEVTFDIPNPALYQYYKLAFEISESTESTKIPAIQFSEFKLYTGKANTQDATRVSTGHNDAAGNITFSNRLSFDHAGTYFFGVVEKKMEGSITSDRHWYKVAVTVGTKTENIRASNLKDIIKNTYYIKSIKVEQFMNTEGHAGTVTEQGLQSIWGKEWDVDGLKYINNPYHLFLSDNKDETGEAIDTSNKSAAFVNVQNVQEEETVNVTVQKQWASYVDENQYYTYCVTVQLFRKNIEDEAAEWEPVGEENVLNRAGAWKHTWYELDKNYIYSVKEKEVYYFDGSGNRKVVSPYSYTTEYSTGGGPWQETSDGAAFQPNDSAGSGTIQIRNTKKYYPVPETGGAGTQSYTMGGFLLLTGAAFLLLYSHTKRRKEDSASS